MSAVARDEAPRSDREHRNAWLDSAACRDMPLEMFFPERGDYRSIGRAKQVCGICTVRDDCLADAMATHEVDIAIRGGLTPRQRQNLRSQLNQERGVPLGRRRKMSVVR